MFGAWLIPIRLFYWNFIFRLLPPSYFACCSGNPAGSFHKGIYSARLGIWMMLNQRLQAGGTLARSAEQLVQNRFDSLLSQCKRAREKKIAWGTGGYCQARPNMPKLLVSPTVDELIERNVLANAWASQLRRRQPRVYVLDGSSVQLEYGAELVKAYANRVSTRSVSFRSFIARPADASIYASLYASRRTTQDSTSE